MPYTGIGSFSHSALMKATSSPLTLAKHQRESKKPGYFRKFIKTFCNKIFGKNLLWKGPSCNESHNMSYTGAGSFSHSVLAKATISNLTWAEHRKNFLWKATLRSACHDTPYTGTGSFSHSALVKATNSALTRASHRKKK